MAEAVPPFHHLHHAHADKVARRELVGALAAEFDRALGHRAALRGQQRRDRFQRRALAGAVAAEQRDDLALRHLERHAAQHEDHMVVDHLDVLHRQHGLRRSVDRRGPFDSRCNGDSHGSSLQPNPNRRDGNEPHPSASAGSVLQHDSVDQEQSRGVMLFSAAYFAAESSISLRMNAGSGAGTQSGHDLELLAVPLHHLERSGAFMIARRTI